MNNTMTMKTLFQRFGLLLSLLTAASCLAQGTAFTYQGRLDDGGAPANGIYDLRFAIYDAASAGTPQGDALTNAATAVSNGLFTVTLDFGNQFPGSDRWLEISVRTTGEGAFSTLNPRQPLTATPYATRSASAASAAAVSGPVAAAQLTGVISSSNIGTGTIAGPMLASEAVTTAALADGAVTVAKVAMVTNWNMGTIANPTPAMNDYFGRSVAALGTDRILIGAPNDDAGPLDGGAAYLLSINGALLTTFVNPTPASIDYFGFAVAAVGTDRVLIGAYFDDAGVSDAGAAYLFSTNGTLMTTFVNPTPQSSDLFGYSLAGMGSDRVLIGASGDNTGALDAGTAYLFSTNGTLITTFTNPTPATGDGFGRTVAALGGDRVLIGAYGDDTGADSAGVAYLFNTNGTLLTTFTNPTPAVFDGFGFTVAAMGGDRVLIGTVWGNAGATDAGAVYLFSTNGALLSTFTNPTPAGFDNFGESVVAVGNDKVLVGAPNDDTGATDTGSAYLFSTNGVLLASFNNPSPVPGDGFGNSVAALTGDQLLIGALRADEGAADSGGVYLFSGENFTQGLIADGVRTRSITSAGLADNAINSAKIEDSTINTVDLADGAVTAAKIGGTLNASQIPSLDASKIATGALADARLSANVALLSANQTFTGANVISNSTGQPELLFRGNSVLRLLAFDNGNYIQSGGAYTPGSTNDLYFTGMSATPVQMVIKGNGNVGIGTPNPAGQLQVVGSAGNPILLAAGNAVSGVGNMGGAISMTAGSGSSPGSGIGGNGANINLTAGNGGNGGGLFASGGNGGHITLQPGSAGYGVSIGGPIPQPGMVQMLGNCSVSGTFSGNQIVTSNSVGIGQPNPAARLDVNGSGWFRADSGALAPSAGSGVRIQFENATGVGHIFAYNYATGTASNLVLQQPGGNVGIGTTTPGNKLHVNGGITCTALTQTSDRNAKENFQSVSAMDVLDKVAALPISTWNFKEMQGARHLGPMAQDFYAAFGLGQGETTITSVDADGVALAAIQGLNQKLSDELKRRDAENAELKRELKQLKQLIEKIVR
jgi:hypothetical protein